MTHYPTVRTLAPHCASAGDSPARIAVALSLLAWLAVLVKLFWH